MRTRGPVRLVGVLQLQSQFLGECRQRGARAVPAASDELDHLQIAAADEIIDPVTIWDDLAGRHDLG